MTTELQMLAWSIFVGIAQILTATAFATKERGVKWNISSREADLPPLKGVAGRLHRAAENFKETFPFFVAAVLILEITGRNSTMTAVGAQLYFFSRVAYVVIYALDITHVRTILWSTATLGILLVLAGAFV